MPVPSEQLSSAALVAVVPPVQTSAGGTSLPYVEGMEFVCQWVNGVYVTSDDW